MAESSAKEDRELELWSTFISELRKALKAVDPTVELDFSLHDELQVILTCDESKREALGKEMLACLADFLQKHQDLSSEPSIER